MRKHKGMSTSAVHSGEYHDRSSGSINTPIYETSTFFFPTEDQRTWEGEVPDGSYIYTRYGNPTIRAAEDKIAQLEGGERCLLFASGMAAISSTLLSFIRTGDQVVSVEDVYGGTYNLMRYHLAPLGIDIRFAPTTDTEALISSITRDTKLVWLESPTNPLLKLVDVPEVTKAAHEQGAMVIIDNTFATPINQRPLEMGVDMVMHSCTKYLNGHSDILAGAVVSKGFDITPLWRKRIVLGGSMDPLTAFLLERGMKTLAVRMRQHNENGRALAEFLEDHPRVERVHYPGLSSHPQHELATRLLDDYGAMMSFEVKGGRRGAEETMKAMTVIKMATSLGGVESLASMPLNSSHAALPPHERARLGIKDSLIRFSAGIEDVEDLQEDLDQALTRAG